MFKITKSELEKLSQEGIVNQEQKDKIISYYQSFAEKRAALRKSRLVKILAVFGVFLIGLGVILFIASNWRFIPKPVLVLLLTFSTILVYYFGFRLKYQKASHKNIGSALIILGGLLYGASLILTAQIYHIDIQFSWLMLVWALGILPVAFLDKSGILIDIAIVLTMIWGFSSIQRYFFGMWATITWQYYLSLPLTLAFALPFVYWFKARHCLSFVLAAGLFWLWPPAMFQWFRGDTMPVVDICLLYLFSGLALIFLSEVHRRVEYLKKFAGVYFALGAIASMISVFVLTFPQVYEELSKGFTPIFFNFIFVAQIIALIWLGLKRGRGGFINAGIVAFAVLIIARYFSLSWGLGSRSVVFIVGGLLMLGAGFGLDKVRKKVIAKMQEQKQI